MRSSSQIKLIGTPLQPLILQPLKNSWVSECGEMRADAYGTELMHGGAARSSVCSTCVRKDEVAQK